MASVSGLDKPQRIRARERAVQAAKLALANRETVHYTQDGRRWNGIRNERDAGKGKFPHWADCSSFVTWCLWNGLFLQYGLPDTVNGADWKAGFTGTLLDHGRKVPGPDDALRGDLVHYEGHVAIVSGRSAAGTLMAISHGSEAAPFSVRWDYRDDVTQIRRYI